MKRMLSYALALPAVILPLLGSGGCCTAPKMEAIDPSSYPGVLQPPSSLGRDLVWRQKVTAQWGTDKSASFEAVLQKAGNALTLIGLNPMGQMGFAISFDGADIRLETRGGVEMPFPARFILLDVQRAFWPWLNEERISSSNERYGVVAGEQIRETFTGGRLNERVFQRADNVPKGMIRIRYSGWEGERLAPERVVLENGWFGYVLTVETFSEEGL